MVSQLRLVNETITSKAYQDNIKSDIGLQYESPVNILKSYCNVRYLVECLGYSAFILEFLIAFDIILICLTGDCFIEIMYFLVNASLSKPLDVTTSNFADALVRSEADICDDVLSTEVKFYFIFIFIQIWIEPFLSKQ